MRRRVSRRVASSRSILSRRTARYSRKVRQAKFHNGGTTDGCSIDIYAVPRNLKTSDIEGRKQSQYMENLIRPLLALRRYSGTDTEVSEERCKTARKKRGRCYTPHQSENKNVFPAVALRTLSFHALVDWLRWGPRTIRSSQRVEGGRTRSPLRIRRGSAVSVLRIRVNFNHTVDLFEKITIVLGRRPKAPSTYRAAAVARRTFDSRTRV